MDLKGTVTSIIDEKLMIVTLEDGKQIFLPWCGAAVGEALEISVYPAGE